MKRMPLVVTGTMLGLAGVLSLNAAPSQPSVGALPISPTTTAPPTTSTSIKNQGGNTTPSTTVPPTTPTTTVPPATTTSNTGVRSATGSSVNYFFGVLSVKVTASGSKIANVTIGSINDGGNYRSQSIDQMAIPQLEQEAMSAQSAKIQGVSGASYTSAGFAQSLQSALTQLHI